MFTIKFLPHNKEIQVEDGMTVIRAAMEAGVHVNASCGGEGVCGKCRVIIEEGVVEDGISSLLDDGDIEKGYRLACQAKVKSNLVVRIPVESVVDAGVLNRQSAPRRKAKIKQMDFNDLKEKGLF
ncbi:MAG: ferredoxin, partial [Deltaproteobacteria bacterium]